MYMVRKQLYIDDSQERQLKARAEELGVSEAEIVRRLLDRGLFESNPRSPRTTAEEHIEAFLTRAEETAKTARLIPHRRADLYEDRGAPGRG
jgi:Zn-dependent peptidase ImmA (M78 family)